MRLEATTQIDYGMYRKYFLFNFLQGKRSPWQARLLLALAPLMFVAFVIFYLKDKTDIVNPIGALIMFILTVILILILYVVPLRYYRSVQRQIEIPFHYVFDDEQVETRQGTASTALRYERVIQAFETRDYFYIYGSAKQTYIIDKRGFARGGAAALRGLLKARLRSRFQLAQGIEGRPPA